MIKIKDNFILGLIFVFLTLICFFLWDYIYLPFSEELIGYEGEGEKFYHHQNDTLRFFLLTTFCLSFYFISFLLIKKKDLIY